MQTQNFLAALTGGYSAMTATPLAGKTYTKLFIFLPGSGEVGDGSAAAMESLAIHGPIAPYRAGVTWFDDNGILVAAIQPPAAVNFGTLQTTIKWLQAHFGITAAHTYLSGLSLGGGWAVSYVSRVGGIAGVLAIEPTSYGPATVANFANCKLTFYTNADDGTGTTSWVTGCPDGGAVTFVDATGKNSGWLQSICGICPLDNHPEHPVAIAHGGGPKFSAITTLRTGLWSNGAWTWVNGTDLVSPATHRVVYSPTGGHSGWDAIYGLNAASFQPSIMSAFLEVTPAVVDPCAAISAQLATVQGQLTAAQTALAAANAVATSATALATTAQANLVTERSAHAADISSWNADKVLLANATAQVTGLTSQVTDLTAQLAAEKLAHATDVSQDHALVASLNAKAATLQASIDGAATQHANDLAALAATQSALTAEQGAHASDVADALAMVTTLKAQIADLQTQLTTVHAALDNVNACLQTAKASNVTLSASLTDLRAKVVASQTAIGAATGQLAAATNGIVTSINGILG